jgi:hypothetical protein
VHCQATRATDLRVGGWWSEMAKMWLDIAGIVIVCALVFVLVALCERERH